MKVFSKCLGLLLACATLASCGGGGSSGGSFTAPTAGKLTIRATRSVLPVNHTNFLPSPGSPYLSAVEIEWRKANGDLVTGRQLSVSITPISVAAFSTLDKADTQTEFDDQGNYLRGNEFWDLLGSGPVDVTGGVAQVFVYAGDTSGTATLRVAAVDPDNGSTVSASATFTVQNVTAPLPASIQMGASPSGIYLQGTTGITASTVSAVIRDGGGQLVPNPGEGNNLFNNTQFEVIGVAGSGTLSGLGAGGPANGTTIKVRSISGIASASFSSGTIEGPIQIRATVDRADNNVDNGISDPLASIATVVVSDGKLFSLAITTPDSNAISANGVDGSVLPTDPLPATPFHNGTYSLSVNALATDRQGNPVIGTNIRFGAIDSPISGFPADGAGQFVIAGNDGNPQESGTLFSAPTGRFTTAGGGAGPGDTLLVLGDLVAGNRDLESSRTIQAIANATNLTVTVPFNRNDDTGNSVDNGPVLPYVIGRATSANITASKTTDAKGVASVLLTYPVNSLGKSVYLFAQGDQTPATGPIKRITDIKLARFAAMADLTLTATPENIPGNTTATVVLCLRDKLGSGLQGQFITFGFTNLGAGSGRVDGVTGSGRVAAPTGANGCTVASVQTSGISGEPGSGSDNGPQVIFSTPGLKAPAVVKISPNGALVLTANPNAFFGSGGTVTLTLRDANGNPVPNVPLSVECTTADVSVTSGPGVTNAQGQTTAVIANLNLNQYGQAGESACKFTTPTGESATVSFKGIDLCSLGSSLSPPPPAGACPTTGNQITLTLNVAANAQCGITVTSSPGGITCSSARGGGTQTCTGQFAANTSITLAGVRTGGAPACPAPGPVPGIVYSGACAQQGTTSSATLTLTTAATCTATVQ